MWARRAVARKQARYAPLLRSGGVMYGVQLQPVVISVGGYVESGTARYLKKTLKLASVNLAAATGMPKSVAFSTLWLRLCTGLAYMQGHLLLRRAQALTTTASLPTPQPRSSLEMPAGWGGGDPTAALGRGSADLSADFSDAAVAKMHASVPFCMMHGRAYGTSIQYLHGLLEEAQRIQGWRGRSTALLPPVTPLSTVVRPTAGVLAMLVADGSRPGASPVAVVSGGCAAAIVVAGPSATPVQAGLHAVATAVNNAHSAQPEAMAANGAGSTQLAVASAATPLSATAQPAATAVDSADSAQPDAAPVLPPSGAAAVHVSPLQ